MESIRTALDAYIAMESNLSTCTKQASEFNSQLQQHESVCDLSKTSDVEQLARLQAVTGAAPKRAEQALQALIQAGAKLVEACNETARKNLIPRLSGLQTRTQLKIEKHLEHLFPENSERVRVVAASRPVKILQKIDFEICAARERLRRIEIPSESLKRAAAQFIEFDTEIDQAEADFLK